MEKVILVLLAAGNSRRFQGNKLLYDFRGKPMYQYIVDQVDQLPQELILKKIVVTQYQEISDCLKTKGYDVIINPYSQMGISSSIRLAVNSVEDQKAALLFAVCDQPYLMSSTICEFIKSYKQSGKGIGCLSHLGRLGNPAIFSDRYRNNLLNLRGDVGGRVIVRRYIEDLYLHEVKDGMELLDIDKEEEV